MRLRSRRRPAPSPFPVPSARRWGVASRPVLPKLPLVALALVLAALAGCGEDPGVAGPDPDPPPIRPDTVASPPQEGRALWISRWDWSDQPALESLLDQAAGANFNVVYLQVRGRSDAYYRSSLEPWAHRPPAFVLGQDPGWDPLGVALERAHALGLELHVWLNALIGWCGAEGIPETTPRHVLLEHPEWRMVTETGGTSAEGCTFLTPGDSAMRSHLAAVAGDIVRRYPVDGVHLDYIRYPNPDFSYDDATLAGFDAALDAEPGLTFAEYRRRLVTRTVAEVRDSMHAVTPSLPLSAAVWGVYRNTRGWANVSTGYDTRFQDAWGWAEAGIVDVIAPMIYWDIEDQYGARLDFAWLADEVAESVSGAHVYVGMGVESSGEGFCIGCDLVAQIYRARTAGAEGVSVFSGRLVQDARLWNALRSGPFKEPVPVPAIPWLGDGAAAD